MYVVILAWPAEDSETPDVVGPYTSHELADVAVEKLQRAGFARVSTQTGYAPAVVDELIAEVADDIDTDEWKF